MEQDNIISEIRTNREKLSARFNHDLDELSKHFKKEQKKFKGRVKNFQSDKKSARSAE